MGGAQHVNMNMAEVFDFDGDSDLSEASETEESEARERIKTRVDEYLTASKLGRLAFIAGDVQLSRDRFNLAMDLEYQTEIESTGDFGVTGGMLREELLSRTENKSDNEITSATDSRLVDTLSKLQKIFITADEKAAFNTADTQSYLLMGAALSMVGEWDKAESVYKEGMAASLTENKELKGALQRLNILRDTIDLVGGDKDEGRDRKSSFLSLSRKPKRPITQYELIKDSNMVRSRSFSTDFNNGPTKKIMSPLLNSPTREIHVSPLVGIYSPPIVRKRPKGIKLFNVDKWRPRSLFFSNGLSPSKSTEDISDGNNSLGDWRERSRWKNIFDFDNIKQSLHEFDSRTVQTMRSLNYITSQSDHDII